MTVLERHVVLEATTEHETGPGAPRHGRLDHQTFSPGFLAVVLSLVAIAALHLVNLSGWPTYFDDEGTYAAQGWAVFQGNLAHYTYWYDHPPAGWIQLAAFMAGPRLFGVEPSLELARYVMVLYSLASAALIFQLCRNLGLHVATATSAMLLWGLSPLVVFEGRQVMLDNMTLPWVIGAFVLATSPRRTLWYYVGAGAVFGVAVLTKETSVLVAPALLLALWTYSYRPTRSFNAIGAVVTAALVGTVYPLYAILKNELSSGEGHVSLQDAIAFQLVSRVGSGGVWEAGSVSRGILDSWLYYDHVILTAGVFAGVGCLFFRSLRPIGVAVGVMVLVALRPNGYMPLMYVIGILPFLTIAVAAMAQRCCSVLRPVRIGRFPVGTAVMVLVGIFVLAYVAPRWSQQNALALTDRSNASYYEALRYLDANVSRDSRIVVDDSYWLSLVNAGWSGDGWDGPIWYFKLDLDPIARDENLPNGWRDVDYLLVNSDMIPNFDSNLTPQLVQAYAHSALVEEWGADDEKVQLRRVTPPPETTPEG